MNYQAVIGLEVHAQLHTRSKLFCGCSTAFGAPPNSQTCEICLGMPGVLPVLNRHAVDLAVRAAIALSCTVNLRSQWSRKNYFYPDLPKGYQISQYDQPYASGGHLVVRVGDDDRTIGITRIHMEEDAGKSVHDDQLAGDRSYVDFNRGGTPLIEIVTEPDIRSSAEAAATMKAVRQILRYLDVCDGNMEQGNLRCDANVSIRPVDSQELGTRAEIKNINSFRFVSQAIDYEIMRQTHVLDSGGEVVQETRLWDAHKKVTRSMRKKEEAHDYRYFPEPDLPDLVLVDGEIAAIREAMPELPAGVFRRYVDDLGLPVDDATILAEDAEVARYFEAALVAHHNPKGVANWMINEVLAVFKEQLPFEAAAVGDLVALIDDGTISGKIAREVFAEMIRSGAAPSDIVADKGLQQVTDIDSIEPAVDAALAAHPDNVALYKGGKTKILGFFVGQVIKATGGKANPKVVNELLRKKLEE